MALRYDFPVGFIVEGKGEYNSFNTLFSRTTGISARTPCSRPQGYGRILKSLEAELTDLVIAHRVAAVIVCIDLKDVLKDDGHGFSSCSDLRESLQVRADNWLAGASEDPRIHVPPETVCVVIQVKKFESWMMADVEALYEAGFLTRKVRQIKNVDGMGKDPCTALGAILNTGITTKNPHVARELCQSIRPEVAQQHSRSFQKFNKEVCLAAKEWQRQWV